jgi:hypothetical protein
MNGVQIRFGFFIMLAALSLSAFQLNVGPLGSATWPAAALAAGNPIVVENQQPGDPGWNDFVSILQDDAISGYGSQISVNRGGSIDFFVTTTAPSLTIDVYRTGWYGGVGARKMLSMGSFPGVHQPIPPPDPATGMIVCNWTKTATLNVPSSWTTGVYLAKLSASSGNKSFIYFVVRNDGGTEDFVLQTSVTTYQAYNFWGGTGLYNNYTNGSVYPYGAATKVSFDRPFSPGDSNGAGQYFRFEYPFVRWAESQGFDLTYTTNVDTHTNVNPLTNHKAFLSIGHDEYWTKAMRDNIQNAVNSGVNVGFFSANTSYWQIRLEPNAAGTPNRVEVGYKGWAVYPAAPGPDPMSGVNNAIVTTNWRDAPVNLPENGLLGVMYEDILQSTASYVVQNASHWIYAGTGFVDGSSVPGIVGYEYDKVWNNGRTPAGVTILSQSPVVGQTVGNSTANSTIYTAGSGARVFASGTIQWSWGLDNYPNRTMAHPGIQRATANILYNFNGGALPPTPTPLPSGNYLVDDFESGNTTKWTGPQGSGHAAAESTAANSGTYGLGMTNGSGEYLSLYADLQGGPQAQTFTRFCFRVAAGLSDSTALAQGRDPSGNLMWAVDYAAPRRSLDVYFWNAARARQDVYPAANLVATDTWYCAEVQVSAATSGHGEVWLNGASVGSVNADLSAAQPYSRLLLANDGAVGTVYFDDVKVANTLNGPVGAGGSPPGPTATSISTATMTPTPPSASATPTPTATSTSTRTATPTSPATPTGTLTLTSTPTASPASATPTSTSTPVPPTATPTPPPAGQYVQDGFEAGLGAWTQQGTGSATTQGATVNSGSGAAALTNAGGQYIVLSANLQGGPQAQTFTRFCFRVATGLSGTTPLAQGRDPNGNPMWDVDYDAPRKSLDVYFWNGARARQDVYPAANLVATDTWYCAEVRVSATTNGHGEVWLNGASVGSVDADLSAAQPYSRLLLISDGAVGTIYFDDIRVANTLGGPVGAAAGPPPAPTATSTSTSTVTPTPLPATPTRTPTSTNTPTSTPTPTRTPTPTG